MYNPIVPEVIPYGHSKLEKLRFNKGPVLINFFLTKHGVCLFSKEGIYLLFITFM
jgi:hypothetical protein